MKRPEPLQQGDPIRIIAPAGWIQPSDIAAAIDLFNAWGLKVEMGKHLFERKHLFSADDPERLEDLQAALDDPELKAILCARGGYGSHRIVDQLDLEQFTKHPKWLIGFSDITVLHCHLQRLAGVESLHGVMAKGIQADTPAAVTEGLHRALKGETIAYRLAGHPKNVPGEAMGILTGGNLSILYSLQGTASEPEWEGRILFVEEVGETHYHVDRMLVTMKRRGVLAKIAGLVVGQMSEITHLTPGMERDIEDTIREQVEEYNIPVLFGFPAGHEPDNRVLIMGRQVQMKVQEKQSELLFLTDVVEEEKPGRARQLVTTALVMTFFFLLIWALYHFLFRTYLG